MREAAQVVSYEVPLGMCVVVPVLIAGTMDLVDDRRHAGGWFTNWYLFHDPFTFITFWVYFTCATASVNRAPFDLAEAESELVAGFHTEYSGLRWSVFFMAEYGSMFAVSGLAAILFFGGWNGPDADRRIWLGLADATHGRLAGTTSANLLGMLNFIAQGVSWRDVHDVGPLDAAAAADRPGDDDVLEVLHADRGVMFAGRRLLARPGCRADCSCWPPSMRYVAATVAGRETDPRRCRRRMADVAATRDRPPADGASQRRTSGGRSSRAHPTSEAS